MNAHRLEAGLVIALIAAGAACVDPPMHGAAWPEADALFRRDPRWLGADAAYSVPLHDGRILWLFGDTFIATSPARVRREARMIRNSVGVQLGADPTRAAMTFAWRGTPAAPASFVPEDGDRWYWPGHGIRLGKALVVFLQRVRSTPGRGLGFEAEGWRAAIVADASGDPQAWDVRLAAPTTAPAGLVVGGAVARDGDHVLALAQREPGDHAGFLARWTVEDLVAGRLDAAEWWCGDGWARGRVPTPVMRDAGPESSVHFDASRGRWLHVRSEGFGATSIVIALARRPEGPWTPPREAFRPPEAGLAGVLVYAAKAHPELEAGGALAVTYATNAPDDLARLLADPSLYYPRFVRILR